MEFKRMDEVEGVIVPYDFESAWEISTSSMNSETTRVTHIGHTFVFFATKVASERNPLTKEGQWVVVVDFSCFHGGR